MNKPSRTFWFLVLAAVWAVVWLLGPRTGSMPRSHPAPLKAAYADVNGGLKTALNMFSNDCGRLPTTAEGFHALLTCPTNISGRWRGPYLDPLNLVDPWGHDYVYRYPGIHNTNSYDLYSAGADGIKDDEDDIGNWQPSR